MSYEILETARKTLVDDAGMTALINKRVYPEDTKIRERLEGGQLPLVTFSMLSEDEDPCGRINGTVQFDIVHRDNEKKTLWDIHRALQLAVNARSLQAAADASSINIRIAAFRQESEDDSIYDQNNDTYRLRSRWHCKYVRTP